MTDVAQKHKDAFQFALDQIVADDSSLRNADLLERRFYALSQFRIGDKLEEGEKLELKRRMALATERASTAQVNIILRFALGALFSVGALALAISLFRSPLSEAGLYLNAALAGCIMWHFALSLRRMLVAVAARRRICTSYGEVLASLKVEA